MQTFLPYASGVKSARVLDNARLGKQRVECLQILASLTDIYKTDLRYKHLGLTPGTVSTEPYAFCTHDGTVWVWNPNRGGAGWTHHPAVRMWDRYEAALLEYSLQVCAEWIYRGYRDTCAQTLSLMGDLSMQLMLAGKTNDGVDPEAFLQPTWWGDSRIHLSHQSNLLRKDPEHYGRFFPEVPDDLPYFWPPAVHERPTGAPRPGAGRR